MTVIIRDQADHKPDKNRNLRQQHPHQPHHVGGTSAFDQSQASQSPGWSPLPLQHGRVPQRVLLRPAEHLGWEASIHTSSGTGGHRGPGIVSPRLCFSESPRPVAIGQQCPTLCQNRKAPRVAEQAHASKSAVLSVGNAEFGESVSGSSPCQEPRVNVSEVDVFNQAALPKHFALEFFAGTARIFSALRKERIPCFPIDIALFRSHNVLDPPITHTLLNWTSSGRISLVWLGMPCTTFSRARRDDGVGPMPLHDDNHLWGLPILSLQIFANYLMGTIFFASL